MVSKALTQSAGFLFLVLGIGLASIALFTLSQLVAPPLVSLPAVGLAFLVIGVTIGVRERDPRLFGFILPNALGLLLFFVTDWMANEGSDESLEIVVAAFWCTQVVMVAALLRWMGKSSVAAVSLAIFSLTHAIVEAVLGLMTFMDR